MGERGVIRHVVVSFMAMMRLGYACMYDGMSMKEAPEKRKGIVDREGKGRVVCIDRNTMKCYILSSLLSRLLGL